MSTLRQEAAFNELVANGGSIARALKKVGYSKKTARTPRKVTDSIGFKELLETELPDELLAKVHLDGLKATSQISRMTGKGYSELVEVPDYSVRHRYLESGYKIKGKLKEIENPPQGNVLTLIKIIMPDGTDKRISVQTESQTSGSI